MPKLSKAQARNLQLRKKYAASKSATQGSQPPTNGAPKKIAHNSLCEACGLGGKLVCCTTCNLVFHPNTCGLPLYRVPVGDWSCWFCVVDGLIPSTPDQRKDAERVVGVINNMKASALAAGAPPLKVDSQKIIESFASLLKESDKSSALVIMKHLSAHNVMDKLESAMDSLSIEKQSEKTSPEPDNSSMQPYPLDLNAIPRSTKFCKTSSIVTAILSTGSFEQQRLILHHVLIDPKVIRLATSIGTNPEEAQVARNIVTNMRRYLSHAKLSSRGRVSNNKRAALNVICSAVIGTPTRSSKRLFATPAEQNDGEESATNRKERAPYRTTSPGTRSTFRALGIPMRSVATVRAPSNRKKMCLKREGEMGPY